MNARALLIAQVHALRSQADALEAVAIALPEKNETTEALLDLASLEEEDPAAPGKKRRKKNAPVSASTARSWIRSGRLKAHQAERGRFVFTEGALRAAIEAAPVQRREPVTKHASLDDWEHDANKSLRLVGAAG